MHITVIRFCPTCDKQLTYEHRDPEEGSRWVCDCGFEMPANEQQQPPEHQGSS